MAKQSLAEGRFQDLMVSNHLSAGMAREYRFAYPRRWRFDFAWPAWKFAVEVDGLGWRGRPGRHQTAIGFLADAEKYEAAMLAGWTVYRVPSPWMKNRPDEVVAVIKSMFTQEENE